MEYNGPFNLGLCNCSSEMLAKPFKVALLRVPHGNT